MLLLPEIISLFNTSPCFAHENDSRSTRMSSSRKLGKKGTANAVTGCKEDDIYDKDVKMSNDDNIYLSMSLDEEVLTLNELLDP